MSPKHDEIVDLERNTSPDTLQKIQHLASGQSRLDNEFEFLHHLGKGAFGDVIKVSSFIREIQGKYVSLLH